MSKQYFRVERPESQKLPIVVDVPHAGEWIPDEVLEEMTQRSSDLKRDLDLYVDRLWVDASALGATLVASNVSRYVIDLNRAADDVSPDTVDGAERISEPGYYHDRGVVWRTTTDGTPVIRERMSREAYDRRIAAFWEPYHDALREQIDRVRAQFGYCLLVDGHSMPSLGRSASVDAASRRADIVPGDIDGASCSNVLTRAVVEHYRNRGYTVRANQPYKGGWITRSYGRPEEGVHAIQIEVNRDLYMDETSFEPRPEGMEQLRNACAGLLERLAALKL